MGKWAVELSWRLITQLPLVLLVGRWGLTAQLAAFVVNEAIYLDLALFWTRAWFSRAALRPDWAFTRPFLRLGAGFWATNAGLIILFRSGTILVQLFTGDPVQVSYYDLALVVFFLVYTIVDQLVRSFLPTVSEFHEGGQSERVASWLQTVTQWGAAVGVMAVVAAQYTARWIMPFVLGADYGDSARVLQVMLLALPALVLVSVGTVATAIRASSRAKIIAIVVGLLVFYGSAPWLGRAYGALGVSGSLTLGLTSYALVLFAFVRHDLQVRWPALFALFGLGAPLLAAQSVVTGHGFLVAIAASALAVLLYLAAALALHLLSSAPLQLLVRLFARSRTAP
jgi:O-antigen/teichoic acid export membrane protein